MDQHSCNRQGRRLISRLLSRSVFLGALRLELFSSLAIGTVFGLLSFGTPEAANAQITILHNFGDGSVPDDGDRPGGGLVQAGDGSFYGLTEYQNQSGVVRPLFTAFKLTPGGTLTIINVFKPKYLRPFTPLLLLNQDIFGACPAGPSGPRYGNNSGAIFRLNEKAGTGQWQMTLVHVFKDGTVKHDGREPNSLIVGSDGELYGTTVAGGLYSAGTVYKLNPTTDKVTILHSFNFKTGPTNPGAGLLLASDGNYYGTTSVGIAAGGSIFMMTPSGTVTTLYTFQNGEASDAPLIQGKDGNFYGTTNLTSSGPNRNGAVFKMTPDHVVTILHSFGPAPDGSVEPFSVVQGPNGNLYGVTTDGGTANRGVLFELTTDGSTYTILHNFDDGTVPNDGMTPSGPLILGSDNNFYGETAAGGTANQGIIFKFTP